MSSSASIPGQRKTPRRAEDATNKKKQKDQANQESKEGERPVGSESKKDLLLDWKQNAHEVIMKLNLGSGPLKAEEVETSFTDTSCVVRLPDGRQWSYQFYEEIESSCSKVQCKKGNMLHLVLQKKIPLHTWASLLKRCKDASKEPTKRMTCKENGKEKPPLTEAASEEPRADGTAEPPQGKPETSNPKRATGRSELAGGKNPAGPRLPSSPSAKRAVHVETTRSEEEGNGSATTGPGPSEMIGSHGNGQSHGDAPLDLKGDNPEKEAVSMEMQPPVAPADSLRHQLGYCPEKRVPPPASSSEAPWGPEAAPAFSEGLPSSMPSTDSEKRGWSQDGDSLEAVANEPEPIVNLTFVKNDSYEKGSDSVVVHIYVKEIHKETFKVLFREQDFTLLFQTSDVNFLRLHPDCGSHTMFRWQVKLRNLIEPDQCTYNFTTARIDICLKKRHSQRWGGLEAPATRGLHLRFLKFALLGFLGPREGGSSGEAGWAEKAERRELLWENQQSVLLS